jgi:mRNA-degrading endonuclease RelE of RelBE toxin-antitoxin system
MSYRIEYEPEAVTDLKQLPSDIRQRIVKKSSGCSKNRLAS